MTSNFTIGISAKAGRRGRDLPGKPVSTGKNTAAAYTAKKRDTLKNSGEWRVVSGEHKG